MINLRDLQSYGTPWRVSVPLTVGDTLVVPSPLRRGPVDIANQRFVERNGIILLGFAYSYVAGAASVGFDLTSEDDAYFPGSTTTFTVWQARSQAAGLVSLAVPECYVPLTRGDTITTPVNGASLKLTVTGTAPTSGFLLLWGIHGTMDFGDMAYSGSPAIFPST